MNISKAIEYTLVSSTYKNPIINIMLNRNTAVSPTIITK